MAIGHDDIPAYFLKVSSTVIVPYLQIFTNFIFNNGLFPNNCKIAKIAPIYKNGSKEEINNYRPILILTCFSTIIENMIYNGLNGFLQKNVKFFMLINSAFKVKFLHPTLCLI